MEGAVGESGEEGIGTSGLESGDGGLKKLAANVELYAVVRNDWIRNGVSHWNSSNQIKSNEMFKVKAKAPFTSKS